MNLTGKLKKYKGCVAIAWNNDENASHIRDFCMSDVPQEYAKQKEKRDGGDAFHLTAISSNEASNELINQTLTDFSGEEFSVAVLGLGINGDCYYLVCASLELDNLRVKIGLSSKDFHVTLGFNQTDKHNIAKDITTLIHQNCQDLVNSIIKNLSNDTNKNIKTLTHLFSLGHTEFAIVKHLSNELSKKGNYLDALKYARVLLDLYPENVQSYYIFLLLSKKLDTYDEDTYKLIAGNVVGKEGVQGKEIATILNIIGIKYKWNMHATLLDYSPELKKIVEYTFEGENGLEILQKMDLLGVTSATRIDDYVDKINGALIPKLDETMQQKTISVYCKSQENQFAYKLCELPWNFSNVMPQLYGSAIVCDRHVAVLKQLRINTIINLIGEESPREEVKKMCEKHDIKLMYFKIADRSACLMPMFKEIQEIISNPLNTCLVHCLGGVGRTNMVLAGGLIKKTKLSPGECLAQLKTSRKVNIVPSQVALLKEYYKEIVNSALVAHSNFSFSLSGLILFVGLPCSGKSTLSMEIYTKYNNAVHLNQDEIGKAECENWLKFESKTNNHLILLDRCNPSPDDRMYWIKMYKELSNKKVTVVYLNLGLDVSLKRLSNRKHHLTLGADDGKVIVDMAKRIVAPTKKEGWDELIEIKTVHDLNEYKSSIGLEVEDTLIKFPRTRHLMNLGAMTRDDLLMDKCDVDAILGGNITIEEKVDGANLGFRLGADSKIVAQNRSHYVNSATHPQFKKLDAWIKAHYADLMHVLEGHNYIIYGEWLYSKHSINYTDLPDYFIMFDLYDADTQSFFSRDYVERIISETNISLVPVLFKGKTTAEKIREMVQLKSAFYSGKIEGVYIRAFDGDKLKFRAKIVRTDFIGNEEEHWTKGKAVINGLIGKK